MQQNAPSKHSSTTFISGLCTTDIAFPFQLWNHLATQTEITCNILRRSCINPTISAYEQLHGCKYDWNAHPLPPPPLAPERSSTYLQPYKHHGGQGALTHGIVARHLTTTAATPSMCQRQDLRVSPAPMNYNHNTACQPSHNNNTSMK